MAVAAHPWYFETDTPLDAIAGRPLFERYLYDHCKPESDVWGASLVYGELVSNVAKHAPCGGVRVWLEEDGDRYALCINDSGRGFTARQLAREPAVGGESGRGLYIVRQIARGFSYRRRAGDGFIVRAILPIRRA